MLIRMIKRWFLRRSLIKFFSKNLCFPHTEFALERGNLITNHPVMSNSHVVSGLDVLDELNKEYNLEEKMLYFSDKTARL